MYLSRDITGPGIITVTSKILHKYQQITSSYLQLTLDLSEVPKQKTLRKSL